MATYRASPDRFKDAARAWRLANPDYGQDWRADNAETARASGRRSYARNRERRREDNRHWEARNPGAHVARNADRRARQTNNPGSVGVSVSDWLRLLARYQHGCAYCGQLNAPLEMDHVIPLARGGRHAIGNVLPACKPCNRSKNALLLMEWRRRRKDIQMAGRGPAPKQSRSRVRDNPELTTLVSDGRVHGPELPEGVLPDGQDWHPQTRALWDALRRSPQLADEPDLGWQFLVDTALLHHTAWSKGRWEFAAEVRLRLAKFGTTPEDRQRLRMKVDPAGPVTGPAADGVTDIRSRRARLSGGS